MKLLDRCAEHTESLGPINSWMKTSFKPTTKFTRKPLFLSLSLLMMLKRGAPPLLFNLFTNVMEQHLFTSMHCI